ncbi:MAG: metallophosphoesterase [Clostridia bacterium]|nr:metallophosphoesterase [Clostridia bacterium]
MNSNNPTRRRRALLVALIALLLLVLLLIAADARLLIRTYTVEADEIETPVRLALVTDLQSCRYGETQSALINAIDAQNPDLILLVGDIFDDVLDDTNTILFLAGISGRYPCYYVTGNHECWSGKDNFARKMAILEKYNISILSGEVDSLTVRGETVNICGVDDPEIYMINTDMEEDPQTYIQAQTHKEDTFAEQLACVSDAADGGYTLLLSHRPEYFELYAEFAFDLVLCGHAHGGQWRIPFLLNGLYAPHQGLFPTYAGGRYEVDGMTMIVSRGLARETTFVPRIFNRPELVIIELT